jgi:hypothetical protein
MSFEQKSTSMQVALDRIAISMFGRSITEALEKHICVQCARSVHDTEDDKWHFRDNLSLVEYQVSALCQNCQDPIFGLGEYAEKLSKDEM